MLVCIFFGMIPMKNKYTPVWRQASIIIIYYGCYIVVLLAFVSFLSNCNSGTALDYSSARSYAIAVATVDSNRSTFLNQKSLVIVC